MSKTKSKGGGKSAAQLFNKPGVIAPSNRGGTLTPPGKIFAQVSPLSVGGRSMFDTSGPITAGDAEAYTSERRMIIAATARLREAGFDILHATDSLINIAGSPKTYEAAFGSPIVVEKRAVIKEFGIEDEAEFMECHNAELPGLISVRGTAFESVIEGIALEEPRYAMSANPFPPVTDYWHHDVPAGISLACNADKAHRAGLTGKGVNVAMVDSGWYAHPFFKARGYRARPVVLGPGASNPTRDESGHGTGESANIFACAPDIMLHPVKMSFVNTIGAFNRAVQLNPDIITNSWGSSIQDGPLGAASIALGNAVASAVSSGITVIFSAGNGHWGYPGQHPDVISAGGAYIDENNQVQASDYASGFASNIYSGRNVPDLAGVVGMRPRAMNIMLPVEPGDSIDTGNAGGSFPNGDETTASDGWAAFSGTSAAAPQLAGVAALMLQANRRLTPSGIRSIMKRTARDVTTGRCHPNQNNAAGTGPDLATGHGLVDANKAAFWARLSGIRLIPRPLPGRPVLPQPIQPIPGRPVLRPANETEREEAFGPTPWPRPRPPFPWPPRPFPWPPHPWPWPRPWPRPWPFPLPSPRPQPDPLPPGVDGRIGRGRGFEDDFSNGWLYDDFDFGDFEADFGGYEDFYDFDFDFDDFADASYGEGHMPVLDELAEMGLFDFDE